MLIFSLSDDGHYSCTHCVFSCRGDRMKWCVHMKKHHPKEFKQILDDIKNSTQAVDEAVRNIRWDDDEDEDKDEDEQVIRNKK